MSHRAAIVCGAARTFERRRSHPFMPSMYVRGLALGVALVTAGPSALSVPPAALAPGVRDYAPGARVLVDAHNAYPSDGQWADRLDRALGTGLPVAIEQDLVWYKDPASGVGRSVVSHGGSDAATAPTFEQYFFAKLQPIMEQALVANRRAEWPLVVLNLDFKTNEPEHHAAVWALLGKYEAWLTTAERTASGDTPAPMRVGPMLVLTGRNDRLAAAFHDQVAVGQRLRLFGATSDVRASGDDQKARAITYATMAPEAVIPAAATNYRRWVNFAWGVVEAGGATYAADWTPAETDRLRALVTRAHAMNLWIRFYTLNGHTKDEGRGWGAGYNFGSADAVTPRWKAALAAGVDFIATDQYEALARTRTEQRPPGLSQP
jgi:hypothetical protein